MSAAPRTPTAARPRADRRQSAAALAAQLETMFGDDEGWIEAWHGRTDPSNPARITLDKEPATRWHWYTRERHPELVRLLLAWGRQYGNVYISTTLYSRPARGREWALPSRLLFVDDAPEHAPLPYSMAVETSAGNRQAYYLLDAPVDAATRQDLQRRIAYASGADKSGHDPEQLGRVAGTWNTKHNKQHPVTLTYADGPRYSADDLAPHFPPVAHAPGAAALEVDDQEVKHWLGNIGELLGHDGLPRRLSNPNGQARRVLAGDLHMPSSSDDRACVCRGLVMHRYPDAEIAALLLHFCDYGAMARKGRTWLYDDIARLIAKERARQPHVTPSPSGAPRPHAPAVLPEAPRTSRARQDRPQRVTDDEYLAWCLATMDAGQQVQMTRKEAAAVHGVTPITISRIERRLRERGAIERFDNKQTHRSWLAVYAPPMMIIPASESDAAAADLPPEVLSGSQRNMERAHVEGTHRPEQTPAAPSPDPEPEAAAATYPALAEAMREAFAAVDGARTTQRRIAGYLEANYPGAPWSDQALTYWYGKVLAERRRERERERLLAGLPSMPHARLRRLERWCDRLLEEGPNGPRGAQFYMADWLAPHVAQELERPERLAALKRTKVRGDRRPGAKTAKTSSPVPVQTLTFLDAGPVPKVTEVDAAALVDVPEHVTKCHTLAPLVELPCNQGTPMHAPGDGAIPAIPWTAGYPMDAPGELTPAPELQLAIEARGSLAAACSSLPAVPAVPDAPVMQQQKKAATAAAYIPAGGWTAESIAALPGVRGGMLADDDPWIRHNRAMAARAVPA